MKVRDAVSGLLAAVLGTAVILEARTFPPAPGQPVGPSLFPMLLGAWLIAAGAALLFTDWRRRRGRAEALGYAAPPVAKFAILLADLLFYAFAVSHLGFLITAVFFLSALFLAFGVRRARILPLALAVTLAVHYAFYTLLRVPLPWGVLEGIAW